MSANEPKGRCGSCGEIITDPEQECKNFNGPMACKPVKHAVNGDQRVIAMVSWYKTLGRNITWQEGAAFKAGFEAACVEVCPRCEGHCNIYDYEAMAGPAMDCSCPFDQEAYVIPCPACQGSGRVPKYSQASEMDADEYDAEFRRLTKEANHGE